MPPKQHPAIVLLGWSLVAAGLVSTICVMAEICSAYFSPDTHHFINSVKTSLTGAPILSQKGAEPFLIEAGGAQAAAFILFLLFVMFGTSISLGMVQAGVHVLSPQFDYKLHRLKQRIDVATENIKSIRITMGRRDT